MNTELLSPAGTLKNMRYAFAYGADAVYAGQPRYSLRVRNNDFGLENLAIGIKEAHQLGKKFYLASNIAPHNSKIKTYLRDIQPVIEMQPDALIMSDPGLIMMVKDQFPQMPIHLSVQANVVNYAAVRFWHRQGIERIILSRELSLDEIEEIRMQCPEMELEVFVHGALCIAYSGRCLLSGYINKRDPNQGTCTNSCRWKYQAHEAKETLSGDVVPVDADLSVDQAKPAEREAQVGHFEPTLGQGSPTDRIVLLQEEGRPNEYMPAFEDEHGTYIMNSKDLRALQHVKRLVDMGIHSLKIEGRTKSHYYVARTAQVYRQAIDQATHKQPLAKHLMDDLENLSNRGYTEGFYRRHVHDEYQNYERGTSSSTKQQFVGEILPSSNSEFLCIEVKNKFQVGDELEIMTPQGNQQFRLDAMWTLRKEVPSEGQKEQQGEPREVAQGSGLRVMIPVPSGINGQVSDKGLLMRNK